MANTTYEINASKVNVPYHKRIAMGEKLDGSSLQSKGSTESPAKKSGGALSSMKKK